MTVNGIIGQLLPCSENSRFKLLNSARWIFFFFCVDLLSEKAEPHYRHYMHGSLLLWLQCVMILLLTFPHSFSLYTLCMLLPHAYYFLFTFLFPSTDFLFFHMQPYCLCLASCTVQLLMHSPAQSAY